MYLCAGKQQQEEKNDAKEGKDHHQNTIIFTK
jgi:hypothetical protein